MGFFHAPSALRGVGLCDDHFLWSYGFRNGSEFNLRQWLKIGG